MIRIADIVLPLHQQGQGGGGAKETEQPGALDQVVGEEAALKQLAGDK